MCSAPVTVYCGVLFVIGLAWWTWGTVVIKGLVKNLRGPPSTSWLTGNLAELNELSFNQEIIRKYGGIAKVHGLFGDEQLYVSDPLALRTILIDNYSTFAETQIFIVLNRLPFGAAMTTVHDDQHKRFRKLLSPLFSASNIRVSAPIVLEAVSQAAENLRINILQSRKSINIVDTISHVTIEVIGRAIFNHPFNNLEDGNSQSHLVKLFFPCLEKLGAIIPCLPFVTKIGSSTFRRHIVNLIPSKRVQALKAVIDAITQLGNDVLFDRQDHFLSEKVEGGKDIVTLLLQANNSACPEDHLSEEDIAAQIRLFMLAGSDTTSSALCRAFEELAQHPDAQETLRKEVLQAEVEHGSFSYDVIKGLRYLHAVVQETLRLHPPTIKLERIAVEDTLVPLHIPVQGIDGKMINEVPIAKNQKVILGIANCNRDIAIWGDDATNWKPERWLAPLPDSLTKAQIPGVFPNLMSFLGGDRSCIGYNFALMEMKIILLIFVTQFRFSMSDQEKVEWKIGGTQYPIIPGKELWLPMTVTPIQP